MQVAQVKGQCLHQWLNEIGTSTRCRERYHHVCKWTICSSGWMIKHHQHKLQLVTINTCASGMFAPFERRETPQVQGTKVKMQDAKVRASISTSRQGIQQQHATTTTTSTDQIEPASTMQLAQGLGLQGKWWALKQITLIALSYCALHLASWPLHPGLIVFPFLQLVQTFHLHR